MYWGTSVQSLVYLEVEPLCDKTPDDDVVNSIHEMELPQLNGAFIKLQLMKATLKSAIKDDGDLNSLKIRWDTVDTTKEAETKTNTDCRSNSNMSLESGLLYSKSMSGTEQSVIYLEQSNLNNFLGNLMWPCRCRGYSIVPKIQNSSIRIRESAVMVTEATMVRVLPMHSKGVVTNCQQWKHQVTGESPSPTIMEDFLKTQNPETAFELQVRMKHLLSQKIKIGTTADAKVQNDIHNKRIVRTHRKIVQSLYSNEQKLVLNSNPRGIKSQRSYNINLFRECSLIVHSPYHNSGKTTVVESIARNLCDVIHIIRPGAIFAKYGTYSDAALETIIHEIILSAAIKGKSICVIIDSLETIVPGSLSNAFDTAGDSANPILNASRAYLRTLTDNLKQHRYVPFPVKNPLYNVVGKGGCFLSVRLCLVAIVTCPDDGCRSIISRHDSNNTRSGNISTVFDTLIAGRYRLPELTSTTRLQAFQWAFRKANVHLDLESEQRLPFLAASAVWARGPLFLLVARQIRCEKDVDELNIVTRAHLDSVFASFGRMYLIGTDISFLPNSDKEQGKLFGSVGGNSEAKAALEDALGLHPNRRSQLALLGVLPPTGILLYGPPGTGKTLLAKSVARCLRSTDATPSSTGIGGAFVSVKSTDVAQAEVGSGEKILVNAFEVARSNAPAVVFIDEFQALFTDRNSGGSGRLSTTLFQCMDSIKQWQYLGRQDSDRADSNKKNDAASSFDDQRLVVLAATNTPWMIDKAFLRPGRFDRSVLVGLPDFADRKEIFHLYIGKMKTNFSTDSVRLAGLCDKLAEWTNGCSGADIASLCRNAAVCCILSGGRTLLQENHFYQAFSQHGGPSTTAQAVQQINSWRP